MGVTCGHLIVLLPSVCAAWRNNAKLSWIMPRECHGYFVDHVLTAGQPTQMSSLLSRFHGFFMSTLESPSKEIQVLARIQARDMRSVFGSNLRLLEEISGRNPWCTSWKEMIVILRLNTKRDIPEEDSWRVPYLSKLLDARIAAHYHADLEEEHELTSLINSLVIR